MSATLTVTLPNLFADFQRGKPLVNRFYDVAKLASEEWIKEFCCLSPAMSEKVRRCDFSYFCAVAAPHALQKEMVTMCCWGNWVFPFDDMFDDGSLSNKPHESAIIMDQLIATMNGAPTRPNKLPIIQAHDEIFKKLKEGATPGALRRYISAMSSYLNGALQHVEDSCRNRVPSVEDMILIRHQSSGVAPLYHLIEYAHHINLPDKVFESTVLRQLEVLGIDMVSLANDIVSCQKELSDGVENNIVIACMRRGMSIQQAFDTVGAILRERYADWHRKTTQLPNWNKDVDGEVQRYVEGIKSVVAANLWWSFRSERYFSSNPERVRTSGQVEIKYTRDQGVRHISSS